MAAVPLRAQWAVADEVLWEAISHDAPVPHAARGRILREFVRVADFCQAGTLALWLVGLCEIGRLLVRQRRRSATLAPATVGPIAVFVGFGARAEEPLFKSYQAPSGASVFRIDQNRLPESGALGKARAREIWATLSESVEDAARSCNRLSARHGRRADFLTAAARRIGNYAFSRGWWRDVKRRHNLLEACFVAADVAAFAATAESVESTYMQHGMLSRHLWFPRFAQAFPLTRFDRLYLGRRLPDAVVHQSRMMPRRANRRRPVLLIASGEYPADYMMRIAPLVRRLATAGVEIRVRLYPGEPRDRFWDHADLGAPFVIDAEADSFAAALQRLEPLFVASWSSTVLIEALYAGILPISVAADDDPVVQRMAYGLLQCCLRWPEDVRVLDEVRLDSAAYEHYVDHLRQIEERLGKGAEAS